jgi:hypothetical protein
MEGNLALRVVRCARRSRRDVTEACAALKRAGRKWRPVRVERARGRGARRGVAPGARARDGTLRPRAVLLLRGGECGSTLKTVTAHGSNSDLNALEPSTLATHTKAAEGSGRQGTHSIRGAVGLRPLRARAWLPLGAPRAPLAAGGGCSEGAQRQTPPPGWATLLQGGGQTERSLNAVLWRKGRRQSTQGAHARGPAGPGDSTRRPGRRWLSNGRPRGRPGSVLRASEGGPWGWACRALKEWVLGREGAMGSRQNLFRGVCKSGGTYGRRC